MLCGIAAQEHERVLEDRARSPVGFKQTEHRSVEIDHGFYVFDEYAQVAQRWPDGRGHDILLSAWNMVLHCPREARHLACTGRSEEHTYEIQSLLRISDAVFCLIKKSHIYLKQMMLTTSNKKITNIHMSTKKSH